MIIILFYRITNTKHMLIFVQYVSTLEAKRRKAIT